MNTIFRRPSLLVILSCVLFLSGCAFGTRHPTLIYPPEQVSSDAGVAHADAPTSPREGEIVLQPFIDQRSDKKTVGTVRNAFGMRTAEVIPTNDVSDWVMEAIRTELQNKGYTVINEVYAPDSRKNYVFVSGEILNVFCDMYFNYSGQVSLIVRAKKDGKEVFNRQYSGEGSAGLAWAMTEKSYAQSLALALSSALNKFIADLDQYTQ